MKKIYNIVLCLFSFISVANADINTNKAEDFIKNLTQQGIEQIVNANIPQAEKDKRFATLFNENCDLDKLGQFVLGRYWRTATPKQRDEFIDTYRKLVIKTWGSRFDEFKGKRFDFKGVTPVNSKNSQNQAFVTTEVPMENAEPALVLWRVEEKQGKFQIVDIIIEGVSLAISARNEYTNIIQKSANGVDGLIAEMKSKL